MLNTLIRATALVAMTTLAQAESWSLDADASKLSFGSVKKDSVGEVHSFESLSGQVSSDGSVEVVIDLASVQTNIDIRNERMLEHVFGAATQAKLNAKIDMAALNAVAVGGTSVVDIEGALSLVGQQIDVETELFVARLSERQVMVTTNDMIFLSMEEAGLNAGIDTLQALAKLSGITRTTPVTMRLMFTTDEVKAAVVTPSPVTLAAVGDEKAGKKVFNRCKACHSLKAEKNGVGPSLHGVLGAKSASVEGYKYSSAMIESGLVWDTETLSAYLANPKGVVPGTKMAFRGLRKPEQIDNVLAYITANSQ
ncbi:MAG: YceI family protein [Sedimentitalea sp.]